MEDLVFKTRLTAWSALRVLRAVLRADIPPRRIHGTLIIRTEDIKTTSITVVDMEVGMTVLLTLMLGVEGTAITGVMVMVPITSDLSRTSRRNLCIPESPKRNMKIMG